MSVRTVVAVAELAVHPAVLVPFESVRVCTGVSQRKGFGIQAQVSCTSIPTRAKIGAPSAEPTSVLLRRGRHLRPRTGLRSEAAERAHLRFTASAKQWCRLLRTSLWRSAGMHNIRWLGQWFVCSVSDQTSLDKMKARDFSS